MKIKFLLLLASLNLTVFFHQNAFAQASRPIDQGISIHNYKQPNKAAEARKNTTEGIRIAENRIRIAGSSSYRKNGNQDYTPKYRATAYAVVIPVKQQKEKSGINPLTSRRNYKTGGFTHLKSGRRDSIAAAF
ncbi:hypothetical protein FEM33_13220 [Dyadobacter flavalbus]|uniref:Uncharacterized protein n=1 Tax=Dyadobacter flavalbus TaxID=2579942 RepID=A0A5M8QYY8_9BACT|nr:hypothetical protein [Dyadobacter flavalbus]KAA6439232.1 hypothetical protein FEM33_13220 [Dyadobacter flavalbus]